MTNQELYEEASKAIKKLAEDKSVPDEQTESNLEALIDEITDLLGDFPEDPQDWNNQ